MEIISGSGVKETISLSLVSEELLIVSVKLHG